MLKQKRRWATSKPKYGQSSGTTQKTLYTPKSNRALPLFWFRSGPSTTTNHLAKNVVVPVTAYMEREEASPLLFFHCKLLWADSPVFKLKF